MTPRNGWLITGGTGFLGRALVRRLLADYDNLESVRWDDAAARICIYSRGEAAQARMREELKNDGRLRWFVGDVRDRERLRRAMESVEIVVHAAALKRVEVGEYNPTEMVKTNILGTQNVIEAAIDAGVRCVVLISSDKAVEPLNCYGATKLVAEKLFQGAALLAPSPPGPKFVVVRYGNVAGSTGSVIPTWRAQLASGVAPIVRKLEVTRFWLTADRAAGLVFNASNMPTGTVYVPELPAYRLGDLCEAMGVLEFADCVDVLGPGEKMHESLLGADEPGGPRRSCDARRMTIDELKKELTKL